MNNEKGEKNSLFLTFDNHSFLVVDFVKKALQMCGWRGYSEQKLPLLAFTFDFIP